MDWERVFQYLYVGVVMAELLKVANLGTSFYLSLEEWSLMSEADYGSAIGLHEHVPCKYA